MKRTAKKANVLNFPKKDIKNENKFFAIPRSVNVDDIDALTLNHNDFTHRGLFAGDCLLYNTALGESDMEIGDLYIIKHENGFNAKIYKGEIEYTLVGVVTEFQRRLRRVNDE